MWSRSYSKTFKNIKKEDVWRLWTDINKRHTWDLDSEHCKLEGPFQLGTTFTLKPIGAPIVKIEIIEGQENFKFTHRTRFYGAIMDGIHEMDETSESLRLTTTIQISGPLSFIWRKIVAEGIVKILPEQTEAFVKLARNKNV